MPSIRSTLLSGFVLCCLLINTSLGAVIPNSTQDAYGPLDARNFEGPKKLGNIELNKGVRCKIDTSKLKAEVKLTGLSARQNVLILSDRDVSTGEGDGGILATKFPTGMYSTKSLPPEAYAAQVGVGRVRFNWDDLKKPCTTMMSPTSANEIAKKLRIGDYSHTGSWESILERNKAQALKPLDSVTSRQPQNAKRPWGLESLSQSLGRNKDEAYHKLSD